MPKILLADNNAMIAEITSEQLEFLQDYLVGEDAQDKEYYINRDTLEMLEDAGCDEELMTRLKETLGEKEDMEIVWTK